MPLGLGAISSFLTLDDLLANRKQCKVMFQGKIVISTHITFAINSLSHVVIVEATIEGSRGLN